MKHTPSPWIMDGNGFSNSWNISGDVSVCDVPENIANARLISAAPEMYEFIEALIQSETNPLIIEHCKALVSKINGGAK